MYTQTAAWFALVLAIVAMPSLSQADTTVTVSGSAGYTSDSLEVDILADIQGGSLLSFGVKLTYDPAELTLVSASKNETDWYLSDGTTRYSSMAPETTTEGEVVIIGGKLDLNNPTAGVSGSTILLGHLSFTRSSSATPSLTLSLGKNGSYSNFVAVDSTVLDQQNGALTFRQVEVFSDADLDLVADSVDQCPNGDDQIDSDNDGTPDCAESCDQDPLKTEPGMCGCGVVDGDSDNDGVCDVDDICAGGDDSVDSDGDGYPDFCDFYPSDPEQWDERPKAMPWLMLLLNE